MNKTEMKETFSKLSEVQQKVLIKALRKISINAFNYFCRSHDIKNLDPNDANWKYDGFIYSFDKRIETSNIVQLYYDGNLYKNSNGDNVNGLIPDSDNRSKTLIE